MSSYNDIPNYYSLLALEYKKNVSFIHNNDWNVYNG